MTKYRISANIHKKPFFSQYINRLKNSRSASGGALALASGYTIIIVIIGIALFYITELFSGDKQLIYATDAAAMAAARQIPSITITPAQVNALPSNFKGLGTDPNGVICPDGTYGNGNPALFGEMAYNNCAGLAMMNAFKAAASGSASDIASVSTDIVGLNVFAQELTSAIKNSQNPPNAAAQLLQNNSLGNLPVAFFGGSKPSAYVSNLDYGYYSTPGSCSNQFFTTAFINQNSTITSYVNKVTSTIASSNGSNYIKGNTDFVLNDLTGKSGFVDANGKPLTIAFVSSQPNDLTHNISTQLSNFSTTPPNPPPASSISSYDLPPNALKLIATTNPVSSSSTPSGSGNSGVPKSGSGSDSQTVMTVLGAAVANIPAHEVVLPPSPPPVTTTNNNGSTTAGAYIAILNGSWAGNSGDYMTNMNSDGYYAMVTRSGLNNFSLQFTSTTPIAFDDSQGDIFDLMTQGSFTTWIIAGADSITGTYDNIVNKSWGYAGTRAWSGFDIGGYPGQGFIPFLLSGRNYSAPATNFNNVVDGTGSPSIPFMFVNSLPAAPAPLNNQDAIAFINTNLANGSTSPLGQVQQAYEPWLLYNRTQGTAQGTDPLGKDPTKDPLGPGGSPALFAKNPNALVPNCVINATSTPGQTITIAQALKIVDLVILNNGYRFFYGQDGWVNNLLPVVCGNRGINYLPQPVEYRQHGFTGIEWLKAQYTGLHGGLGITQRPGGITYLPSTPASIFVPTVYDMSDFMRQTINWSAPYMQLRTSAGLTGQTGNSSANGHVWSGIRYFTPVDNQGNLIHPAWPEPPHCQQFMTPGTPLQLLQNMNILNVYNNLKFNPNDHNYNNLLNALLNTVQQWNANITMSDLLTVLDSQAIDIGKTFFLIYVPSQSANHGLQMVTSLPNGQTYQPLTATPFTTFLADLSGPNGQQYGGWSYWCCYPLTGVCDPPYGTEPSYNTVATTAYWENPTPLQNIIDTAAAPNSTYSFNNQFVCPAPYGDNKTAVNPYPFGYGGPIGSPVARDSVTYQPGFGYGNNQGEVWLLETVNSEQCLYTSAN